MKFQCCKITSDVAGNSLVCNKCKNYYHILCLYPSDKKKTISNELKKSWVCPECSSKQPKEAKNDNTPIKSGLIPQTQCSDNVTVQRGGARTMTPPSPPAAEPSLTAELVRDIVAAEVNKLRDDIRSAIHTILAVELKPIREEIKSIKDSQNIFNQRYDDLTKRIHKVEMDLESFKSVSSDIKQLKLSVCKLEKGNDILKSTMPQNPTSSNLQKPPQLPLEDLAVELRNRELRSKNIVVAGISEDTTSDLTKMQERDRHQIMDILRNIYPDCPLPVKNYRLGKQMAGKLRLVKICFESDSIAKYLLRNKSKLKDTSVRLYADQTPLQKQYMDDLRKQLLMRTENGETNLIIKYIKGTPKIVKKDSKN